MNISIQSLHFDADQKLKSFIEKKVNKLHTYHDKIIDSDIVLSLEQNGTKLKNKIAVVKTKVPGAVLVAKESTKVFEESVDLAVDSIRRQLKRHKQKTKN